MWQFVCVGDNGLYRISGGTSYEGRCRQLRIIFLRTEFRGLGEDRGYHLPPPWKILPAVSTGDTRTSAGPWGGGFQDLGMSQHSAIRGILCGRLRDRVVPVFSRGNLAERGNFCAATAAASVSRFTGPYSNSRPNFCPSSLQFFTAASICGHILSFASFSICSVVADSPAKIAHPKTRKSEGSSPKCSKLFNRPQSTSTAPPMCTTFCPGQKHSVRVSSPVRSGAAKIENPASFFHGFELIVDVEQKEVLLSWSSYPSVRRN